MRLPLRDQQQLQARTHGGLRWVLVPGDGVPAAGRASNRARVSWTIQASPQLGGGGNAEQTDRDDRRDQGNSSTTTSWFPFIRVRPGRDIPRLSSTSSPISRVRFEPARRVGPQPTMGHRPRTSSQLPRKSTGNPRIRIDYRSGREGVRLTQRIRREPTILGERVHLLLGTTALLPVRGTTGRATIACIERKPQAGAGPPSEYFVCANEHGSKGRAISAPSEAKAIDSLRDKRLRLGGAVREGRHHAQTLVFLGEICRRRTRGGMVEGGGWRVDAD